jgi:hypothetical protein
MLRISVARLSYSLLADPRKEHEPVLHYWLSQDVSLEPRSAPLRPPSGAIAPFSFQVPTLADGDLPLIERIQRANLNIDVFAKLANKHGQTVRNQAGSVRVPLYELLLGEKYSCQLTIGSWGDPNANGENRDDDVDNVKGTLEFDGPVSITLDGVAVPPLSGPQITFLRELRKRQEAVYRHYMGSTVVFCRRLGYRWGVVKDINAYVYQCRAGILPASAYLGTRPAQTGAEYFEAAARTVLQRARRELSSFDWERDDQAPAMLGRVLTLAANYMNYVPGMCFSSFYRLLLLIPFSLDVVYLPSKADRRKFLRKALESFDLARFKGGGDCEDLALEILLEAAELRALVSASLPKPLRDMQALAQSYVFSMALGGVSSAEINGDYGNCTDMGAHMCVKLIRCSFVF